MKLALPSKSVSLAREHRCVSRAPSFLVPLTHPRHVGSTRPAGRSTTWDLRAAEVETSAYAKLVEEVDKDDVDYVLLTTDPVALLREIKRLRDENETLKLTLSGHGSRNTAFRPAASTVPARAAAVTRAPTPVAPLQRRPVATADTNVQSEGKTSPHPSGPADASVARPPAPPPAPHRVAPRPGGQVAAAAAAAAVARSTSARGSAPATSAPQRPGVPPGVNLRSGPLVSQGVPRPVPSQPSVVGTATQAGVAAPARPAPVPTLVPVPGPSGQPPSAASAPGLPFAHVAPAPQPVESVAVRKRRQAVENSMIQHLTDQQMDIVFVSAEVAPWSKTGGLGDVAGSLPIALAARGHRVMVVAPRYQNGKDDSKYDCALDTSLRVTLDLYSAGQHEVGFFHCHRDNVDWVFVDHPVYHRQGTPYTDAAGVAFPDNVFRYALLSLAACEAPLLLHVGGFRYNVPPGFPYGDSCVFVANDWHAGLVPSFLASRYRRYGTYRDARCVFAIHNLSHQGVEPSDQFPYLGLPEDWYDPVSWRFPDWAHITGPAFNILKGALVCSDRLVTVSQGYAWEVTTPEGGWGLHELLKSKAHVLNGITNGIDLREWDPATDTHIEANYSWEDMSGKAACKAALQRELGLEVNPDIPLVGWIGRLDWQKGPDLVLDAVAEFSARGMQMVMLGSGSAEYEGKMRQMEEQHKWGFRGWVGFSIPIAHRIIAGADVLLMPSRFEPCGLNQLFAMRYGTIPVAHATGGLRDTIREYNAFANPEGTTPIERTTEPELYGCGWTFGPPEVPAMLRCLDGALHVYRNQKEVWTEMQLNGMTEDLSWGKAAQQYEQIFKWALMDNPVCQF